MPVYGVVQPPEHQQAPTSTKPILLIPVEPSALCRAGGGGMLSWCVWVMWVMELVWWSHVTVIIHLMRLCLVYCLLLATNNTTTTCYSTVPNVTPTTITATTATTTRWCDNYGATTVMYKVQAAMATYHYCSCYCTPYIIRGKSPK